MEDREVLRALGNKGPFFWRWCRDAIDFDLPEKIRYSHHFMTTPSLRAAPFCLLILSLLSLALFGDPAPVPAQESSPLERGIKLLDENKVEEAIKAFEESISTNPGDPLSYYYAGVAYHRKGDLKGALASLNRAIQLSPGLPQAILEIGIILEELGRFENAREAYRAVAERKEDTPLVREAGERLRRLTIREHFQKAGRFYQERRYEDALRELQALLSLAPDHVEAHRAAGMTYQRLGRFKEAIESFKKVTEIDPRDDKAFMQLAQTYEVLSAYEEAIGAYKMVISLAPGSPQAADAEKRIGENERRLETRRHFEAAADLIRKEKWPEALKETEATLASEPENPHALFNHGLVLHQLKEDEQAIEYLKRAVAIDPKLYKAYYQLGVIYDDLGQYKEAVGFYEQALATGEKTPEAEKAKGRLDVLRSIMEAGEKAREAREMLEKEDIPGAIREMESLLLVKKDDPKLLLSLATLYIRVGRLKDAAPLLERSLSLNPKDAATRFLLATVYEGLKEYAKAVEAYEAVAAMERGTPRGEEASAHGRGARLKLHFDLGKRLLERGDYEASLREMQAVLEIAPDDPVALFNIGTLYFRLNRPEEAEPPLRRAVSLAPDYIAAYLQLGLTLERLRKFTEAREAFEKVIEIQGDGREARIARARIESLREIETLTAHLDKGIKLMGQEKWDEARREAEAVIAIDPKNYIAYYYMGIILDRSGIPDEARKAFEKVIEINPRFLRAYLSLGDLLFKEGEYDEAKKAYDQVVTLGKDAPEAEMAATRLRALRPWTGVFSLTQTYSSNISLGAEARSSIQSNYGLTLRYALFREKEWNLAATISANQTIYYKTQFQGNGYTLGMEWMHKFPAERTLRAAIYQNRSYFEGESSFVENQLAAEATTEPRTIPTSATIRYAGSRGVSQTNKASDAERHNLSLSLSQKVSLRDTFSGSYAFNVQKNLDLLGSNYANRTHTLSLNYNRSLWSGASSSLRYSVSLVNYSNPDSTTFFQQFRRNINQVFGAGISLKLSERVSFSLNYSYSESRTNLPRPSAEERRRLEEILSTPIPTVEGGYRQHNASLSFTTTF